MRTALGLLLALSGCREIPFTCATNDQCADGVRTGWCESDHRCSFSDSECPSGRRYAPFGDQACVPPAPACAVVGVAAGGNFACAWSNAGHVACWGDNGAGQLGDGTTNARSTPARANVTGVAEVVAGPNHACARHGDGTVTCWGENAGQQLGLGDGMSANHSTPVTLTTIDHVAALAAGTRHTCARLADGSMSCWGRNNSGQLGDGTITMHDRAVPVTGLPAPITSVAAGNAHSCASLMDGSVWCWGNIKNGPIAPGLMPMQLAPAAIADVTAATRVVAGDSHACALAGGQVTCWGLNDVGQAGDKALGRTVGPTMVPGVTGAVELAAGTNHTCAALESGGARCWGGGASGQLGGVTVDAGSAAPAVPGERWSRLAAGLRHSCGLTDTGEIYCWGRSAEGQLGDGTQLQWLAPEAAVMGAGDLAAIAAGTDHTCALGKSGTVFCWGRGDQGQLASVQPGGSSTALPVTLPGPAAQIVSGNGFSCARLADGTAQCWGRGARGQIGDKTTTDHVKPAAVAIVEKIVHLAAGSDHACAVTALGTVYCWGDSGNGRLGNGAAMSTPQSKPLLVTAMGDFVQVGAGNTHTCALTRAQQVVCWGSSVYGQAGVGPVATPVLPTAMAALPPVALLGVGGDHTCVVAGEVNVPPTVRCWGRGDAGQLGFGTTANGTGLAQPVAIESFGPATALAAAPSHSCAIVGGVASCWGSNRWGQLGTGKTANSSKPVAVVGLAGVVAIDTGDRHTCAVLADGTAHCWGANQFGQLGNGSALQRPNPVRVSLECP
jgi:alpha-tubulin suppressor-like RCC1 family protein